MTPRERNKDERRRLAHTVARLRAMLDNLEIAMRLPGPIGEAGQAIAQTGTEIAVQVARADAYELADVDAGDARQREAILDELARPEAHLR